jgi:phytoene dehydrogenase-like protein
MARVSFHDVIVVGQEPGGLLAAGLLRRQGYRILLAGKEVPESYLHEEVSLPTMLTWLPPHGHAPILDDLLSQLAVEDPVHRLGGKEGSGLQLITPAQRVDISADPNQMDNELRRAAPEERSSFMEAVGMLQTHDAALQEVLSTHPPLPPESLIERSRFRRMTQHLADLPQLDPTRLPPLFRLLVAATAFISGISGDTRIESAKSHLILGLLKGMRHVPDFDSRVRVVLRKLGVDIEDSIEIKELRLTGKEVTGIAVAETANTYNCGSLLANLRFEKLTQLIPTRDLSRRLGQLAASVRTSLYIFSFNLLLPEEMLPLGCGHQLILVRRPDQPLTEDNLIRVLRLSIPALRDQVCLNFSCLAPSARITDESNYVNSLQVRLLSAAQWLIPFLDEKQIKYSSPKDHAYLPHAVTTSRRAVTLGMALIAPQPAFQNLIFCGPEAIPGLGIEGAAYAAKQAIRTIGERVKLKKLL